MKIAIITAGGAGMFCGSCMQDNTLAKTLRHAGHDAVLIPTYTPIRVDETDNSSNQVFMGGINVYLDSAVPGWNKVPRWLNGWLDRPSVISALTRLRPATEASKLGSLTVDMLAGSAGPQRREVHELCNYLCEQLQPDLIIFSNALLSGILTELKPRFTGKIICLFQGDDIFLQDLTDPWQGRALDLIHHNCQLFDGFLTHSEYYRDFICEYVNLQQNDFRIIPLTIDSDSVNLPPKKQTEQSEHLTTIGYFARICPQKGIHRFLDCADRVLHVDGSFRFVISGYLPDENRRRFLDHMNDVRKRHSEDKIQWQEGPDSRDDKFRLLSTFDALCVPTEYREPKGLYVLEAGLAGVPSIVPAHGAFPELIRKLGHGRLFDPNDTDALDSVIQSQTTTLANDLPAAVTQHHGLESTAEQISNVLQEFVSSE